MWTSKEGDVRREEFLKTAFELFLEKGYEKTSINDIIKKIGVTKGAFYYYFKSKDEILNVLCMEQAEHFLNIVQQISADGKLSALDKINQIITNVFRYRAAQMENRLKFLKLLENEGNLKLAGRINEYILLYGSPVIRSIIEQGIHEGTFVTEFPAEAAELYIQLSNIMNNVITKLLMNNQNRSEAEAAIKKKTLFYEETFEKLLGIKKGCIHLSDTILQYYF